MNISTRLASIISGILLGCAVSQAQITVTEHTPSPTVMLSQDDTIPAVNVSQMAMVVGDWTVKPLYEVVDTAPKVLGLFLFRLDEPTGSNFRAVFFSRDSGGDCGDWFGKGWIDGKVADAVADLKATYGIPDEQDPDWEIDQTAAGYTVSTNYSLGFEEGDEVGEVVNSLQPSDRSLAISILLDEGYAAADLPFETGDEEATKEWLVGTAQFFEKSIGRNLSGADLEDIVALALPPGMNDPTCDFVEWVCNTWVCRHRPVCEPKTVRGAWRPDGEACECHTYGPWSAVCGTFTADARGKVKIHIPYPPPLGTTIELEAGIGAQINVCVCAWRRTCVAAGAVRTVTTVHEDCTTTVTTEYGPSRTFSSYGFMVASDAAQCQLAAPPEHMPPEGQDCGLENP